MPRPKKKISPSPALSLAGLEGITFSAPVRPVKHVPTHLWSLDRATGGGPPERTITELSAYEGVGKSTLGGYLLGLLSGEALVCPLEAYDPNYLARCMSQAGFQGQIWEVPSVDEKGKIRDDEYMLDALVEKLAEEQVSGALIDSVGAVSPIAEQEGSSHDANMGRRARVMAPIMRKLERLLIRHRVNPALVILCNHLHPNLGVPGSNTSGGKAIHFHSSTRIRLSVLEKYDDGSRSVEGKVFKLRFRDGAPNDAVFYYFIKANLGVHVGLSALEDCLKFGLASKDNGIVKLNDKSFGRHSALIEQHYNDPERFAPFQAALKEYVE